MLRIQESYAYNTGCQIIECMALYCRVTAIIYINQKMLNEPLEEIMGKLLEDDSAASVQLQESKDLFLLPMDLVDELNEAVQMFGGSALV
ncbi:hypothetical protein JHK87_026616 [Glycine soja]|nr:hypothetical protein JHK87_026616 [Glycine soja]